MKKGVKTVRQKVLASAGGKCVLAGPTCTGTATTIDHWVPRSRGGRSARHNYRPACLACNQKKGRMTPDQWWEFLKAQEWSLGPSWPS